MSPTSLEAIPARSAEIPQPRPDALEYLDGLLANPGMQLLLACCRVLAGTAEPEEPTSLISEVSDWNAFRALCREHRVTLPVQKVLIHPFRDLLPPDFVAAFEREARDIVLQQMRLRKTSLELHRAFLAAGLRHIFLKGTVLDVQLSGEEILRHSRDVDVLIDPTDFRAADAALAGLGFTPIRPPGEEPPESPLYFLRRKDQSYGKKGVGGTVELHWRTDEVETLIKDSLFDWSEHVMTVPIQGRAMPVLADAHACLYLCLHAAKHDWSRLGWLLDIPRFMRKRGVSQDALLSLATRHGLRQPVLEAFALSDRFLGTAWAGAELGFSERSSLRVARRIRTIHSIRSPKLLTLLLTFQKGRLYSSLGDRLRFWFLFALNQGCYRVRRAAFRAGRFGPSS